MRMRIHFEEKNAHILIDMPQLLSFVYKNKYSTLFVLTLLLWAPTSQFMKSMNILTILIYFFI